MNYHKLGATFKASFTTVNASGAPTAADSATYTVYKNNVAVGAMTDVAATQVSDFRYTIAPQITSGNSFAAGDHVAIYVTAVVSGVSDTQVVGEFEVSTNVLDGVSLSATGLDAIPTTAPSGVASTFREMVVAVWRRFYKKTKQTSAEHEDYADDDTTVLATQTVTATSSSVTIDAAE